MPPFVSPNLIRTAADLLIAVGKSNDQKDDRFRVSVRASASRAAVGATRNDVVRKGFTQAVMV